ncbi:hypothetical protein AAON49_04170 [Pseudotenacibaculum sp. MALMAid0570]|uniref:hypothetical protein n=1 Tax=Pseudotenacibaculum sp. MALMAid0570 TaxID=3143938 RepID=UPI0032E0211A
MIQFEDLILQLLILIIPTTLAFVGAFRYMRLHKNTSSKLITLGSVLILLTWLELFVLEPLVVRKYFLFENSFFQYLTMTMGAVGYISFFVGFFLLTRKLVREEQGKTNKNDLDSIDNIGK